jgi:uncharacterized membrane protein YdbT with pleckstrin-like domain
MAETAHPGGQAASASDGGPSEGLRRVLRDDETVLWSSKPVKRAWYWGHLVGFPVGFALVMVLVGGPFAGFYYVAEGGFGVPTGMLLTWGGAIYLFLAIIVGVSGHLAYRHAEMGLTEDRVVRMGGIVGRDASSLALEDVRNVDVRVLPWDKAFGTGRVRVRTAGGPGSGVRMSYVAEPQETVRQIEDARKQAEEAAGGSD